MFLLKVENRGYEVNQRDAENVTLLHWAAINNRMDIVKYLIMKGQSILLKQKFQEVQYSYIMMFETLLHTIWFHNFEQSFY